MSVSEQPSPSPGNVEAVEAWDGPLFDRFVKFRHIVVAGLKAHGDEAMRIDPPRRGDRVLDIGCGFGDTTQQLAELVGPHGHAVGVDASARFIATARDEARDARVGTMFFANPVRALRNVRAALGPGARLVMVVWRAKIENEWLYRAQTVTERFVTKPEDFDEPTCGPGPFSMANADTVSGILHSAGYDAITLRRCDLPIKIGDDVDEAVELVMSLGPAGEISGWPAIEPRLCTSRSPRRFGRVSPSGSVPRASSRRRRRGPSPPPQSPEARRWIAAIGHVR